MAPQGALSAMRGVRREVLTALKRQQPLTAGELGARFGLTANALRRHLKQLEEDGLVRYEREVRGVGGPVFAYRLTESGDALFPQAYAPLLSEALTVVREALGSDGVRQVLERRWAAVAAEIRPQLEGLPLTARVERLAALLTAHGYMAEAEVGPDGTSALRARHCALAAVAREHPEVCAAEADFLARMLDETIDRRARIIEGCRACEYTIGGARRATLERTG